MEFQNETNEREMLALELLEYERQFSSLLENARLYSLVLDSQQRIIVINSYFLERTGWKKEEVIGKNWIEIFLPIEQQEKARNLYTLLQQGYIEETKYMKLEFLARNGERIQMGWNSALLKDKKGQIIGFNHVGEQIASSSSSSSSQQIPNIIKRKSSTDDNCSPRLESIFPLFSISGGSDQIGDYIITKPLGKDNSHVKLAIHNDTNEKVAIKFLPKSSMTEQELQRARRETAILKQLNTLENPYIVKFIDAMETDAHIILIQEYVSGGELVSCMEKNRGLPEHIALRLFRQILFALECCHKNKIIHRDLKLQNILLDEKDDIKLIDFGVSNFMEDNVFRHTFCGTPAYAPPEILLGEAYHGPEVDLWSIGVVLYYMLTGKYPFPNIGAILSGKFHKPETISPSCLDLLERLLTVDTKDRINLEGVLNHPWTNCAAFPANNNSPPVVAEEPHWKKRRVSVEF